MNRRSFIQSKIAGTAIIASSGLVCKASAENPPSVSKDTDLLDVDVLVVGEVQLDMLQLYRLGD